MKDDADQRPKPAAGPRAVLSSLLYTRKTAGFERGLRSLLEVNQTDGFDCPGCAWPDPSPGHRATAEFCENGARAVAHEADARRVERSFFASHSLEDLRALSDHALEHQGRLVEPMIKRPGSAFFEPIAYEEAIELTASRLRALPSPDQAAFYTSGRTSNEAAFLYQLMVRSFGTNNLPDCSNMCHESSGKGLLPTLGIGKGTVTLADFEAADCIFIIGQNPGTNHPRMLSTLAEARARGARIVSVNPLREAGLVSFAHPQQVLGMLGRGQPIASDWVRVRINGDVAFFKGVMKCLFELDRAGSGVLDRAFIAEHTSGFEAFAKELDTQGFEALEAQSGVSRDQMAEIAKLYAESERVIACWAMGLTQHKNGVANVREIVNLLLLRGNIGKEGAGVCPVRGHSNVQGDRTMGIHEASDEAFIERLEAAIDRKLPHEHGLDTVGTIAALEAGDVRVFVAMGGNFVAASPDSDRTRRAMESAELTLSISTKLNRSHLHGGATTLVLPCLTRSERDLQRGVPAFVTVENSMGIVHPSRGSLTPIAEELRSEPRIVADLASALLGAEEPVPWQRLADDYDRIRDLVERSIEGFEEFNRRVREPGGFSLPNGPRDRRFTNAEQRALFTPQPLPALDVRAGELVLMTIRSHDQFNTTIYDLDDRYRGVFGERRVVFVAEEDLAARGFADGDLVDIESRFGDARRRVSGFRCIAYDLPKGCAAAYFPETNPLVILEDFADESRTPSSKSIVVRLEKTTS